MTAFGTMQIELSDNETVFTRFFNAPRGLVWRAWTDPEQLARWWGPHTFTNPVCEVDLRPGGAYRIVMRSPDGSEAPMNGVFLEIAPPERLVMTTVTDDYPAEWHEMLNRVREGEGEASHDLRWTVTFEERDGGTMLAVRTQFASVADRDAFLKMRMADGWAESLEDLAALLEGAEP